MGRLKDFILAITATLLFLLLGALFLLFLYYKTLPGAVSEIPANFVGEGSIKPYGK